MRADSETTRGISVPKVVKGIHAHHISDQDVINIENNNKKNVSLCTSIHERRRTRLELKQK